MKRQKRYDYELKLGDMEKPNKEKSMTMPDDALTLETLLTRFTQGIPLETKAGQFPDGDEDTNIDDIDLEEYSKMDLTDQALMVGEMRAKVEKAKKKIAAAQAKKLAEKEAEKKASEANKKEDPKK